MSTTANNGGITVQKGSTVRWGALTGNAPILVDPATNNFTNLTMLANGYISAVAGSQFNVSRNFTNGSTQSMLWNTGTSALDFSGGGAHTFDLAGQNGVGFANNFAWGTLKIDSGNTLDLAKGSGDALYVDFLQGLDISGRTINNIDGANGLFLYYNPANNPTLTGDYTLAGGGELVAMNGARPPPTPEPSTLLLIVSGLGALVGRRNLALIKKLSSTR